MASIAVASSSSAAAAAASSSSSSSAIAKISGHRPSLLSSSSSPRRILLAGNPVKINSSVSQKGSQRFSRLLVRTTTSTEEATTATTTTTTETSLDTEELIGDLKAKWDAIENKTNVFIYGGGALVAIWVSSTVISAVNSVPLLPKVLELVGLGYTGWFVYRYLLFKESRKELARDIEDLTSKITGTGPEKPAE